MLVVAYIGFGNSVCRYHLPYVERRKDTIKVKYIYRRMEDRVGDEERETWSLNMERIVYVKNHLPCQLKKQKKSLI